MGSSFKKVRRLSSGVEGRIEGSLGACSIYHMSTDRVLQMNFPVFRATLRGCGIGTTRVGVRAFRAEVQRDRGTNGISF